MFLVGLTGGIATGKSTVSKILSEECGCSILDADLIAREVVRPGTKAWKEIKRRFGDDIMLGNGEINREKLGEIIFTDPTKRKLLNSITHPEIYKSMLWKVFKALITGHQFVILDLPLLFETGKLVPYASYIIVISCSEDQQIERLMKRNKLSLREAQQRINSQMPLAEKCAKATYVIDNSSDLQHTKRQVKEIHRKLRQSKKHWKFRFLLSVGVITIVGSLTYLFKYIR